MATVTQELEAASAEVLPSSAPSVARKTGTSSPVGGIRFDAATQQRAFWRRSATRYGSGNVTGEVEWYADTAVSGNVVFTGALSVITPNTDSQDIETNAFAAQSSVTDSHLGTTVQRLHRATITVTNLDSLAADDDFVFELTRDAGNASDTMAGFAIVTKVLLLYSDI